MDLVKRTVAQGATDDELGLYLHDCKRRGVHPLDKLLHFTKRGGRYTPVTSIDLMRSRAAETGQMAGSDDAQFCNEVDNRGWPEFATVTVYRLTGGMRFPYIATARWSEYYPGDGPGGTMWRKMPHVMLGKCAEALALRKAFPAELAGLYAKEEMDQADVPAQRLRSMDETRATLRATGLLPDPATQPDAAEPSGEPTPQQEPAAAAPSPQPHGGGLSLLDMAREAAKQGNQFFYGSFWDMRTPAERKKISAIKDELNVLMDAGREHDL
jgi:phage recombination protein Bet